MAFQGTLKTTLSGAMSRVGSGSTARELEERRTRSPRTRDPEGTLGRGLRNCASGTRLEKAGDNVREVGARSEEGGKECGDSQARPTSSGRALGAGPARPRWAPGARWRPPQAARTLPRRSPGLLTFVPRASPLLSVPRPRRSRPTPPAPQRSRSPDRSKLWPPDRTRHPLSAADPGSPSSALWPRPRSQRPGAHWLWSVSEHAAIGSGSPETKGRDCRPLRFP